MLKYFITCGLVFSLALAAPPAPLADPMDNDDDVVLHPHSVGVVSTTPIVEILESGASHQADGSYHFHFRAEDGSFREETAVMKNPGTKKAYLEVSGAYSYFDVNGEEVIVHYKANHRGFVPEGGNIPDSIAEAAKRNSQLPPVVEKRTEVDDNDDDHDHDHDHDDGSVGVNVNDVVMPTVETVTQV